MPGTKLSFKARKGTLKQRVKGLRGETGFHVEEFATKISALFEELKLSAQERTEAMDGAILALFENIKRDTPVDTGRARSGWTIQRKALKNGVRYDISNNVHYIVFLEFGHSSQAPQGMVRKNLNVFSREISKELRKLAR